jgi:hypothetical protein
MAPLDLATGTAVVLSGLYFVFNTAATVDSVIQGPPIIGEGHVKIAVVAGDTHMVYWKIHKKQKCLGENSRVWSGQEGFYLSEPYRSNGLPKTTDIRHYVIPTEIPAQAPEGALEMRIEGYVDCGKGDVGFTLGPVIMEVVRK